MQTPRSKKRKRNRERKQLIIVKRIMEAKGACKDIDCHGRSTGVPCPFCDMSSMFFKLGCPTKQTRDIEADEPTYIGKPSRDRLDVVMKAWEEIQSKMKLKWLETLA